MVFIFQAEVVGEGSSPEVVAGSSLEAEAGSTAREGGAGAAGATWSSAAARATLTPDLPEAGTRSGTGRLAGAASAAAARAAGATRAEGAEEASNLAGRDPPGTAPPGTTSPDTTPVKTTIAIRQLPGESAKRTCIVTCLINLLLPLKPLQELSSSFSGA